MFMESRWLPVAGGVAAAALGMVADGRMFGIVCDDEIYRGMLRQTDIAAPPGGGKTAADAA